MSGLRLRTFTKSNNDVTKGWLKEMYDVGGTPSNYFNTAMTHSLVVLKVRDNYK